MIDTDKLMRGDRLLYGSDVVQVLTISKTSLRVYNITKDEYIAEWIDDKHFDYLPIEPQAFNILKDGSMVEIEANFNHELNRILSLWELKEE